MSNLISTPPVNMYRVLDAEPCLSLNAYISNGGGVALDGARNVGSEVILEALADSGLRGRGGAGFPTAKKWRSVISYNSATSPTAVLINGAEGEPSTFKDRFILRNNPYRVIEGALIACEVIGADELVVCLKASFTTEMERVRLVLAEIEAAGWARNIVMRIVAGPDSYLFGEETALLEVASGRLPFPRVTPPWRRGLDTDHDVNVGSALSEMATLEGDSGPPALVNNVETFANVTLIVGNGATWFREVGTPESPGTIVCTVTGDVQRHGVAEFAMGTPLSQVIDHIGLGARPGAVLVGVLPGVSSSLVQRANFATACSHEGFAAIGSALGSAGFLCLDDSVNIRAVAAGVSRFLAVESCGQCTACKRDGIALAELLDVANDSEDLEGIDELDEDKLALVQARLDTIVDGARCSLASQQRNVVGSLLPYRGPAPLGHVETRARELALYMTPLLDIVDGNAHYDEQHLLKNFDWSYDAVDSGQSPVQRLQGLA